MKTKNTVSIDLWVSIKNLEQIRDKLNDLPKDGHKKKLIRMMEITALEAEITRLSEVKETLIKECTR